MVLVFARTAGKKVHVKKENVMELRFARTAGEKMRVKYAHPNSVLSTLFANKYGDALSNQRLQKQIIVLHI